jgi:hypothetical protein
MAIADNDPRVLMFKKLLERVDALPRLHDPEVQAREVCAIAAQAGEMLKQAGIGAAVQPIFAAECPEFSIENNEQVANFQRASAEIIHLILEPIMPSTSGKMLALQLHYLSEGDDAPLLRRTKTRNQRMPNLGQYEDAKKLFVYRCAYEAGAAGALFLDYLASKVPGRQESFNVKHIEQDWAHASFVDRDRSAACREAGKADRLGIKLTPELADAKEEALLYTMEQLLFAMDLLSRKIRPKQ